MIRAAIVGIGTWGRNLVGAVQGKSELIGFVAGATRTPATAELYCKQQGIRLMESYAEVLAYGEIDAVVLATPHSMHCEQIVAAALYLAGSHIGSVVAQSERLVHDYGADDTTSMLFRFQSGASAYLGTVIATAETWRLQIFGSKGWLELGDVAHLHTWDLKVSLLDPADLARKQPP